MSLGVDDRSPSTADASEMMEGWREWHGLTRTAATKRNKRGGRKSFFFFLQVCVGTESREDLHLNVAAPSLNKYIYIHTEPKA